MIINAFAFGSENPKLFIVIDILILGFVFMVSIYISIVYNIFINSTPLLTSVYVDKMPMTSTFILNLPAIIGTLGALIMIFSYSGIKKANKEGINVIGA